MRHDRKSVDEWSSGDDEIRQNAFLELEADFGKRRADLIRLMWTATFPLNVTSIVCLRDRRTIACKLMNVPIDYIRWIHTRDSDAYSDYKFASRYSREVFANRARLSLF